MAKTYKKEDFPEALTIEREKRSLSMNKLATIADVPPTTLTRLENGTRACTLINAVKIAKVYQVPIEPLILFIAELQGFDDKAFKKRVERQI